MTVGCQNEMVVVTPVTLHRTLTCVARHLGGATHESISEAVQSKRLRTTQRRWMQG